ncbi:MAG: TolB family protein, partial [Vicinamibacterales bacterium]
MARFVARREDDVRFACCLVAALALPSPSLAQSRPVTFDDVLALRVVSAPAISPGGEAVLFVVREWQDGKAGKKESRSHVWKAPADASAPARQVTFGDRETQPSWSPDGRYMSFVAARATGSDPAKAQVWVMRSDGGEARVLTTAAADVDQYAWAPDGRHVAFTAADAETTDEKAAVERRDDERQFERLARPVHLWIADLDSKDATRITSGTEFTILGPLSWAPDST